MSLQTIHYTHCPSCNSSRIAPVMKAKDHTVTGEVFSIWHCENCSLRFTQDVPPEEVIGEYYRSENYISHAAEAKGLIGRIYLAVRKRTIRRKRKLIISETGHSSGNLLDIGSGVGSFAAEMKRCGWTVQGIEPDEKARQIGAQHYGIELSHPSQLFNLPAARYDAITLWHVLEHVHSLQEYMQRMKELMKPGGKIFIAVPNYTSQDAISFGEYWASWDVPRHLYHFSPESMNKLLGLHGLRLERTVPMWYDSFYISLLSTKYKSGSTQMLKAFVTGLRSNWKALFSTERCSSLIYIVSSQN